MPEPDSDAAQVELDPEMPTGLRARIRTVFSGSRDLIRLTWRDPEHVPERLTLYAAQRLAEPSQEWADRVQQERPDVHRAVISEELRTQTARIARVDGAISGTPFFIALLPGYLSYLWQEARMTLRIAALYGHDPSTLDTTCEMLALRGVHPDVESARAALTAIPEGVPPKPTTRRTLGTWVRSVRLILIFGGFMSAPTAEQAARSHRHLRTALSVTFGIVLWVITWVLPLTFMVAMAWGCETHARQLGRRTMLFYDGEADSVMDAIKEADRKRDKGHSKREILRSGLLALTIIVPIGFVAYADRVRNTTGVPWIEALGALVAVALVMALAVVGSRR